MTHGIPYFPHEADEQMAYAAGFDCGRSGPSYINCHFKFFSTEKLTDAWEKGKADAIAEKSENDND